MDADKRKKIEIAQFRFSIIAPTINGTFTDASMAAYFRRMSESQLNMPDGTPIRVNPTTIAGWRQRYLKDGFDALIPKMRSDNGASRRIDCTTGAEIERIRKQYPSINATMLYDRLIENGTINADDMSISCIRRWIRAHPIPAERNPAIKDRRAFEAEYVNGIWQADTLFGPYVGEPRRRAYLQTILDDKSRKIVASRFVGSDNATTFQDTLKQAIGSHGIPEKLFVDNGGPYRNGQLSLICGGLGIVLCHAAVRDGAAKGKIERLNRTIRSQFLSVLPPECRKGIDELNASLAKWVLSYNTSLHSSTKKIPAEAFAEEAEHIRYISGGPDALHDAFLNRIERKVAQDATVRIKGVLFDVPLGYIGCKVSLRFTPGRTDDTWLVRADGSLCRIAPTDKVANANTLRIKPTYSIDFSSKEVD